MAEQTEVQALSKISTEIDESQINVLLTNQCIKAQKFLLEKLKKQSERHKEECGYISSANLKLECEIKQAESEIHSLRHALETIKNANIELKKDYLLAKEKKGEIAERINAGEKKYEQLWLESKSRYESIPFVKKLLQAQNRVQILLDNLVTYETQAKSLAKEIEIKRDDCKTLDKNRIVKLAEFVVHDVPRKMKVIQEKIGMINELVKELEEIEKQVKAKDSLSNIGTEVIQSDKEISEKKNNTITEDLWPSFKDINDDVLMMPKFYETNIDLDIISDKLEKIKKADMYNYTQIEEVSDSSHREKDSRHATKYDWSVVNMDNYISPYFIKKIDKDIENEIRYSDKKLINILDDVNIGKHDALNILSKINPLNLQEVNIINSNLDTSTTLKQSTQAHSETEGLASCADNIVVPPTQFLDSSQGSQEAKKKVSFQSCISMEISEKLEDIEIAASPKFNNTLDSSAVSDEDFVKIKDMVLKKHNLESSPQFVYAKNTIQPGNNATENIVKSTFFDDKMECDIPTVDEGNKVVLDMDYSDKKFMNENPKDNEIKTNSKDQEKGLNEMEAMEVDNTIDYKPKICDSQKEPVSGLLFTHGDSILPESLDVSISTTGYNEGEADFPHYIDSNLLLSPRADVQVGDDNSQVKSQEVPNFLSGLRKTGLSLFGDLPSSTPDADSNNPNQNPGSTFKFSFGGDDKKGRGGFFNIFN